jgi:hypothetical protein
MSFLSVSRVPILRLLGGACLGVCVLGLVRVMASPWLWIRADELVVLVRSGCSHPTLDLQGVVLGEAPPPGIVPVPVDDGPVMKPACDLALRGLSSNGRPLVALLPRQVACAWLRADAVRALPDFSDYPVWLMGGIEPLEGVDLEVELARYGLRIRREPRSLSLERL